MNLAVHHHPFFPRTGNLAPFQSIALHLKQGMLTLEQLIVIIEKRIIKEEEDQFGLFLDGDGHIPRAFLMLNSDERLYRLKHEVMEWIQFEKVKGNLPRLPPSCFKER